MVPLALDIAREGATQVLCFKHSRELSPTQSLTRCSGMGKRIRKVEVRKLVG